MKIALITKKVSQSLGGAERVSVNLAGKLSAAGHDVHILTSHIDTTIEGTKTHLIKTIKWLSPLKLLSFQHKVRDILKKEKFDLVYSLCQVYPVSIYRVGDGIHRHWMRVLHPNTLLREIKYSTSLVHSAMRFLEGKIFKEGNCRLFITNSKLIKDQIIEYFQIPEDRIKVVYNGVDHELFNPDVKRYKKTMREKYGVGDDELVLLFIANNWERKGLSTIIKAMSQTNIEKMRLAVVGRGKKAAYVSLARECKINADKIIFIGHVEDAEKFYGMSDIFILPTRYEPFSNVCLEAMACGLPVATTRMNGASELIRPGENGFIIEDWSDSDALARIIKIWSDRAVREGMGAHALRIAKDYTWERHIEETGRVFEIVKDK